MISNKLSVNPNKTEYLLFNPSNVSFPVNIINLGSNTISPNDSAKNLGVIFQTDKSMDKHISSIVKSCFLQLRDFCRICPFISKIAAITLANAFVHSNLDFSNSLFYGLPKYSIYRLQKSTKYNCLNYYKFFSFFAHNSNSRIFTLASFILSH